ncbi:MAG: winged helix-turn-helix domain-containing protein, partial [Acidimicrobiia bacterium]|nr:winged helix-turn-helix domain-containing protein [Acidimicrobiia bacterium]
MVQIGLLGGVTVSTGRGELVDVGPARCQLVLAALALSAGSAVPVSRLVDMVWGTEPPRTAEKTLQSYVTRLRKGLGPKSIVRTGAAYRLEVDADAIDVLRFQRRLDSGDIDGALDAWNGPPLAGLDTGGMSATVNGLIEQWLGAVEVDLDRRIETDAVSVIGTMTELTAKYPFREGLWALLMTALYRVGRQADALTAYRRAREHLVEELGVEPGPRLRELEASILGHDEHLVVDRVTGGATGLPTGTVTFGFCDIEGSTRLWAEHRTETAAAMARHEELVLAAVDGNGGYIFASGGDSFGVAFHRASDAVAWAVQLQAMIGTERWPGGVEVRLRIGLHTGEAEERGDNYFGTAVNVAARIADAGHGGQTLVSASTAALLDDVSSTDLVELGEHRLKDLSASEKLWQVGGDTFPGLRTLDRARHNLPVQTTELFGRSAHIATVADLVRDHRLVTL